ncbi:MAG: hypothetical protein HYW01_10220 [Deltaproteobacteria bacterium]|nr:hypothetical protein [Deltaproteobacteria bacterium]
MFYRILKSLQKIIKDETTEIEFSSELNMTLSFIESGFLPTSSDGKTVFIFKGSQDEIDSFKETDQVIFEFECIKRPEFPSVKMSLKLKDRSNKTYRFDYFFNVESDEEMELLERLEDQDYFDIIFFDSKIEYSKRVEITKNDKDKIKTVLVEARS